MSITAALLNSSLVGVGKTTLLREISRLLADEYEQRVMIVDTSNEIGGDGDIAHNCIGRARRMPVSVKYLIGNRVMMSSLGG